MRESERKCFEISRRIHAWQCLEHKALAKTFHSRPRVPDAGTLSSKKLLIEGMRENASFCVHQNANVLRFLVGYMLGNVLSTTLLPRHFTGALVFPMPVLWVTANCWWNARNCIILRASERECFEMSHWIHAWQRLEHDTLTKVSHPVSLDATFTPSHSQSAADP